MSKIAFLFPGQGAQKAGMGKEFYEKSTAARQIYDQASECLGFDMKKLCFEENEQLDLTEYTQAAMVTTCLAIAKVVREKGIEPEVTAGLSLGEYCAVCTAGGMKEMDAVKLVRTRGILMQNTVPKGEGAMAAVLGMETEILETVINAMDGVTVANYNCPGQIVITGETSAVEKASAALKEAGAKRVLRLNVSGPFHSPMLKDAGVLLRKEMECMEFSELKIPYVTNVSAEYVTDIRQTKALLETQVSASVRWQECMEKMIANGVDTFVEIGPGRTLNGFLKKINKEVQVYNIGTWEELEQVTEVLVKNRI